MAFYKILNPVESRWRTTRRQGVRAALGARARAADGEARQDFIPLFLGISEGIL